MPLTTSSAAAKMYASPLLVTATFLALLGSGSGVLARDSSNDPATATPPAAPSTEPAPPASADTSPGFAGRIEVLAEPSLTVRSLALVREELAREPGGVAVVAAESFRAGRASTVDDILGSVPGVIAQSRFGAEEARLSIRGSGIQRTFHGRGLQLLQDGVPLNLADGSFDFQAVEPLSIRYATVHRGANGFDRGATSLGGAIDLVSPTGHDSSSLVRVESGASGYLRGQLGLAVRSGQTDAFLAAAQFSQDGFRDHAEQNTQRLFANLGRRHSDSRESRIYLSAVSTDSELPGSLTQAQLAANPQQAAAGSLALDQKRDFDLLRLAGRSFFALNGGATASPASLELGGFYSYKHLDHPIFQVLDQRSHDFGLSLRYGRSVELAGRSHELTMGITPTQGDLTDERFQNLAGERGNRTALGDTTSRNVTAFVEDQFQASDRLSLLFGLAASQSDRAFDDQFLGNGDQSDDRSFKALLPRLGVILQASPDWSVFANVARSFEPPTFGELANLGGDGLAPVDEQTATSFEVGMRGGSRGDAYAADWDLSLYHANVDGELLSLEDEVGNPLGTINADRTVHSGVELGGSWRQSFGNSRSLTVRGAYTFSRFRFDDDPVFGDNTLAGLPQHLLRASAELALGGGFSLNPAVTWSPESTFIDHANTREAAGYTVWDLRAGFERAGPWQAFVEVRNLADRTYAVTTGVVANARGRDTAQFFPGDGRALYAGLEWRWGAGR